jgi:Ca2+-transporting ATPase
MLILFHGALMAAVGVASFAMTYGHGDDLNRARTATFCTVAFTQLFFSFACRSQVRTLPELGLFSNPYLFGAIASSALLQFAVVTLPLVRSIFDVPAHPGGHWLYILPLALLPVTVVELAKLLQLGWPRGDRSTRILEVDAPSGRMNNPRASPPGPRPADFSENSK